MTSTAGLWLAVILSGAYHGMNPGMGWPLAVSSALMEQRQSALWRADGADHVLGCELSDCVEYFGHGIGHNDVLQQYDHKLRLNRNANGYLYKRYGRTGAVLGRGGRLRRDG